MPELSLLVIRVSDLEKSRAWYERLGFKFSREQHGDGPVHYAAIEAGFVFELYPESAANPVSTGVRLGLEVQDVHVIIDTQALSESLLTGPNTRSGRAGAVLVDPDGIKVEINGAKT